MRRHYEEEIPWFSLGNLITIGLSNKPGGKHCQFYTRETLNEIVNEASLDYKISFKTCLFYGLEFLNSLFCGFKSFEIAKFMELLILIILFFTLILDGFRGFGSSLTLVN